MTADVEPPVSRSGWWSQARRLLSHRDIRLLWMSRSISITGTAMIPVALVFAVLEAGGSATAIGLVFAAQMVPNVVLVLAAGVWADRLSRNWIMVTSDILNGLVQLTLGILLLTGHAEVWHIVIAAAINGTADAFYGPASTGLTAEVVPRADLQSTNAMLSFSQNMLRVVGPAISGLLCAVSGPGLVFLIDGVSFVVSSLILRLIRLAPRHFEAEHLFWRDLRSGWSEMTARRWYWSTLISHSVWNAAIAGYFVLGPAIAESDLGGAAMWGLITTAWAIGGLTGNVGAFRFKPARPLVWVNLGMIVSTLPMLALIGPAPALAVAGCAFLAGSSMSFTGNLWEAAQQELIPQDVLSRVDSYDWLLSLALAPAGLALVGPLADAFDNDLVLLGCSLACIVPALAVGLAPSVRAVGRGSDGLMRWEPSGR